MGVFDLECFPDQWLHQLAEFLLGFVPKLLVRAISTGLCGIAKLAQGFMPAPVVPAPLGDFERTPGVFSRLVRLAGLAAKYGAHIKGIALLQRKAATSR